MKVVDGMSRYAADNAAFLAVAAALDAGQSLDDVAPNVLRRAVHHTLAEIARQLPGRAIELRVPPHGAVQCGAGPRHTRGTPPNVVEADPIAWLRLAVGGQSWDEAIATGLLSASGPRAAELAAVLPLAADRT